MQRHRWLGLAGRRQDRTGGPGRSASDQRTFGDRCGPSDKGPAGIRQPHTSADAGGVEQSQAHLSRHPKGRSEQAGRARIGSNESRPAQRDCDTDKGRDAEQPTSDWSGRKDD
jgi:hypothetical protein